MIFSRHIVISHAILRQHDSDPKVFAVLIGRAALANRVFVKTRAILDAQDSVNRSCGCTDSAADNRTKRPRGMASSGGAFLGAAYGSLSVSAG